MKVVVLGAGIVGTTAAYFLARDGHEVRVIDRQPHAANETSFSNAGMIAPGHAYTWASPRAPRILLQSLWRKDTALRLKLVPDVHMWAWCWQFLKHCNAERARVNTTNKLRLCRYSQQVLQALVADTGIEYDRVTGGAVYVYRDPALLERGIANSKVLTDGGLELRPVDPDGVVAVEPAFAASKDKIAGGLYCPSDESGDCHRFARKLADIAAERHGVAFHFDTRIVRLAASGGQIEKVVTDKGEVTADAYVLALGSDSPIMSRKIGVKLPIYPVKGYSVTIPIRGHNGAPRLSGVDENNLVAWSRLGNRLRLTATAEFAGYDTSHKPEDFTHMLSTARGLFPDGGDFSQPAYWAGLRPMTPAGTPILGASPLRNLWLDTGQGHMGWTMSFGSARVLTDLIAGRKPEIDLAGLTFADLDG